jgi:peroxiredoxin
MRNTLLALIVTALVPFAALPAASAQEETKPVELKVGKKMTHFDLGEWIQGTEIKRIDPSKVYVIDIWSSAAPLCKRSIPYLNGLYEDLSGRGLVVVGVTPDDADSVRNYLRDKASTMTYPIGVSKENSSGQSEAWFKFARTSGALPLDAVVNRAGQICYVGSPLDPEFERILRLAVDDRYDTELNEKAKDMIGAARRAAKIRNFREATRLYEQVVDLSARHFTDIALEHWRMLAEQVLEQETARTYIRKLIERVNGDEPTLIYIGNYLATNTEIKKRDLEAATLVADALRKKGATTADSLGCIAAIQAANGDFEAAAETQYDAWMSAMPSNKAAHKRALDSYRENKKKAAASAGTGGTEAK